MASESKPMDIEEEVDEIEDEIKKPEEGQVAERELNYKREPDAQDLTAPDVFARFRKETLPILEYYQNQNLLYEIDGKGEISIIYKEIQRIIHSLET